MQELGRDVMPTNLDYQASIANFQNGSSGAMLPGGWEVNTFTAAELPFDMAPIPPILGESVSQADSHTFVIPKRANRPAGRLDTTLEFVRGMLDRSLTWAQGGQIPAWKTVVASERYRRLEPQSHYASAAERTIASPPAWFSGAGSDLETEAWSAFLGVMSGASKPEAGLAQLKGALGTFLDKPSPV